MPYKDIERQKEAEREWARKQRALVKDARHIRTFDGTVDASKVEDLQQAASFFLSELLNDDTLDNAMRGRVAAQIIKVSADLIDKHQFNKRLEALEGRERPTAKPVYVD